METNRFAFAMHIRKLLCRSLEKKEITVINSKKKVRIVLKKKKKKKIVNEEELLNNIKE